MKIVAPADCPFGAGDGGIDSALRCGKALSLTIALLTALCLLLAAGCASVRQIGTEDATAPDIPSVTPQNRFVRDVTASLPGKGYCTQPMNGALLDIEKDIPTSQTAQEALSQLYRCFLLLRDCGADTVFIRPDLSGRFAALTDENGAALDLTAAALAYAQAEDYYTVLTVDDRFLPREEAASELPALSGLLERYDFDALLYAPASAPDDTSVRENIARIRAYLDGGVPVSFGCAMSGDPTSVFPTVGDDPLFAEHTVDFVCVNPISASVSFDDSLTAWNAFAARYPDTVFYCALSAVSGASGESPARETGRRIELLYEQEQFRGSIFSVDELLSDAALVRQISEYRYREDPFTFAVRSMSFTEDGSAVLFGGNAIEGRKLTIDRTVIAPNGGPFAVSCVLNEGPNRFLLRNAGYSEAFSVEKVPEGAAQQTPSPYADHGLGRALMCRVDSELTQHMDAVGVYDTFSPDYFDLPVGTLDYVTSIGFEDGVRYALASGGTVSAEDATLLSGAYILPANSVSCLSSVVENNREILTFSSDWAAPVNLKTSSQPYRKGYFDFSYNIDGFSAEWLDLVFSHTAEVLAPEKLVFGEGSLFLRAQVVPLEGEGVALRLYLKSPSGYYGASLAWDQTGRLVLTLKKKPAALTQARVMLDPGHGGPYMTGTALNDDSLSEKDVTMDLARKVRDLLTAQGVEVIFTRENDYSVTLRRRKEICAVYDPDLFVSIHCDGVDDLGQSGTHSFYYKPFSQPLAACIHRRLVDVYSSVIYTKFDRNYGQIDKSIKYYPYYVTRTDVCPSVLVEAGFMSNDFEGRILADDNCRMWIADAMARGIIDYLAG